MERLVVRGEHNAEYKGPESGSERIPLDARSVTCHRVLRGLLEKCPTNDQNLSVYGLCIMPEKPFVFPLGLQPCNDEQQGTSTPRKSSMRVLAADVPAAP